MKHFVQEATHTVKDEFDARLRDLESWIAEGHNHILHSAHMLLHTKFISQSLVQRPAIGSCGGK